MSEYCGYGYYSNDCGDGLSYGARAGIGVGIAAVVVVLCILAGILARRKRQRRFAVAHQDAIHQSQMAYGGGNPGTYGGYAQTQPGAYGQGQAPSVPYYAPPPGTPPADAARAEVGDASFYAPPPGPPPPAYQPSLRENKKAVEV